MNKPATLHRHLFIIRQLRPPYRYPSKEYLENLLEEEGFLAASKRTLERDFGLLLSEYGIKAAYHRSKNGYYLELPTDEDVSDFDEFVKLLERKERMDFLTSSISKVSMAGRYLQLENSDEFKGSEHLPLLWEALTGRRVIRFTYQNYSSEESRVRLIEPGILFEYRNRWYLAGWDLEANGRRTFGLDRIANLSLTGRQIAEQRGIDYRTFRSNAIGVTAPPDGEVEEVVLRFTR
jgi:predicted DNA-binding transcriptional regulator YafY